VRPVSVVVDPPSLDRRADFVEAQKPVLVEALVAKLSVEALDVSILDGTAGVMKRRRTPRR
jgi:hypothetical protein